MNLNTSTFFIQLSDTPIESFYKKYTVFGEVVEGLDTLDKLNKVIVDEKTSRPIQNIRIKHTIVIDDPFEG
jgi:peptidyl-prolyl cis-trans isomerase-like 4